MPAMPTGKPEAVSDGLWRTDRTVPESILFAVPRNLIEGRVDVDQIR